VNNGQIVQQGDPVGLVGIADADLGPHLHFEIRPGGGKAVDPAEWLRVRR
jgi:murein DD-endopeptidase MepM/ murein hydrolase activator NlpD